MSYVNKFASINKLPFFKMVNSIHKSFVFLIAISLLANYYILLLNPVELDLLCWAMHLCNGCLVSQCTDLYILHVLHSINHVTFVYICLFTFFFSFGWTSFGVFVRFKMNRDVVFVKDP